MKKTCFLGDVCGNCQNFKTKECKKSNRAFVDTPCIDYVVRAPESNLVISF